VFDGLFKLAWLELKIFLREPMGAIGSVLFPVILFVFLGRFLAQRGSMARFAQSGVPVLAVIFIALGGVLSLTAILSIYREGGILKRLRATPLHPITILSAHVVVKLLLTGVTLGLLVLAGKRWVGPEVAVDPVSFALAVVYVTASLLALGFVIASVVPTARFAQPLASMVLYPLLVLSGVFFPVERLPGGWQMLARLSPITWAVDLLQGLWEGGGWIDHSTAIVVLALNAVVCGVVAARIFRWE